MPPTTAPATASGSNGWQKHPTKAAASGPKPKRISAYDRNFVQHCIGHRIYPPFYKLSTDLDTPEPANMDEIQQALMDTEGKPPPDIATKTAFRDFQYRNKTTSEGTVMRTLIPVIAGTSDIPNEGHLCFTNLESITGLATVSPTPDFFDGTHPEAVHQDVRRALHKIIVPTAKDRAPVAPNLFLEAKGPDGNLNVAEAQAMLDGAYGTNIMLTLQNYLLEEPEFDGNAYAFTATFLGGFLTLYAHHATAPAKSGQPPSYHTTQIDAYALAGNYQGWVAGISAFRKLRELAKRFRDQFVEVANERARSRNVETAAAIESGSLQTKSEASPATLSHHRPSMASVSYRTDDEDDAKDSGVGTGSISSSTSSYASAGRGHSPAVQSKRKLRRDPPSPSSSRPNKRLVSSPKDRK